MNNFIKTIISALKVWVTKKIDQIDFPKTLSEFENDLKLSELENDLKLSEFENDLKLSELENDLKLSEIEQDINIVNTISSKSGDLTLTDIGAMNIENPIGTGSFSLNRQDNSTIGDDSVAVGRCTNAIYAAQNTIGRYNLPDDMKYVMAACMVNVDSNFTYGLYYSENYTFDGKNKEFILINPIKAAVAHSSSIPVGCWFVHGDYRNSKRVYYKRDEIRFVAYDIIPAQAFNYGNFVFIVGNGTSDEERSNAHTLDWHGNAWYSGDVYVGGTSQDDEEAKKLITEDYIDTLDLITIEDIDDICGDIIEETLPQSDVDELMARIEE